MRIGRKRKPKRRVEQDRGSALIVALWVVLLLSTLVSTFAFEMHVEARIASLQRKRFKARALAEAGIAYARALLDRDRTAFADQFDPADEFSVAAQLVSRGVPVRRHLHPLGAGRFEIDIIPENARRNVHQLSVDEWKELLARGGVPSTLWDSLIDCFLDWIDENDLHRLNGAESDDPYYRERGYEVKDAPLDTVDELLLIKHFTREIVYGGVADDGTRYEGIADSLTVWGGDKLHINAADENTLWTVMALDENQIATVLEGRLGPDGIAGTFDDGFETVQEAGLEGDALTTRVRYYRIRSRGRVGDAVYALEGIFRRSGGELMPVLWEEGEGGDGFESELESESEWEEEGVRDLRGSEKPEA
ncbi:general secretion pathway protein GspK [Kiritimatiella glycovorans]|uniref:Type II secretory pathway, component PulK n=1 Tax=Kiritimatiella glycovorans TaxID=1307763 RepID=A0A0G3EIM8_9BACT|nr:type II secretion system protein GspK [Kiritimatiella glycovorans]AKJ63999.1 Type II secretory pathway, component PulK [Kiritimatiella glycovorans]